MTNEEETLRAEIAALGDVKSLRRYDEGLRRRILRHALGRLSDGEAQSGIAASLGVSQPTLSRMLREGQGKKRTKAASARRGTRKRKGKGFVAVTVAPERAEQRSGYTVRGPCGMVVEGVSVADLVQLFARMSCSA